jgi:transposase
MIPHGVQIFFALDPIDMRWSFDRLSGIALERVGHDVRGGALFMFCGKRRTAMKILFFDGSGLCIFYKRLDSGQLRLPTPREPNVAHVEISDAELEALLDGVELQRTAVPQIH